MRGLRRTSTASAAMPRCAFRVRHHTIGCFCYHNGRLDRDLVKTEDKHTATHIRDVPWTCACVCFALLLMLSGALATVPITWVLLRPSPEETCWVVKAPSMHGPSLFEGDDLLTLNDMIIRSVPPPDMSDM